MMELMVCSLVIDYHKVMDCTLHDEFGIVLGFIELPELQKDLKMQRGQKSLRSFFGSQSISCSGNRQEEPLGEKGVSDSINPSPSYIGMLEREQTAHNQFELLKKKLLRPQKAPPPEIHMNLNLGKSSRGEPKLASSAKQSKSVAAIGGVLSKEDGSTSSMKELQESRSWIPGNKRIRDEESDVAVDGGPSSSMPSCKKLMEADGVNKKTGAIGCVEERSKFDWLHPSRLCDAQGRKQSDPYFDKRTVQIPPWVVSKMSASQKQYWDIKSQYMDTVLFFKVGKFYELYELDAEIGQRELNWKMTISGVGKCRQVGIPESGIDSAVQSLLARGYKVGRIEQMETAEQAKIERGPKATIQRKLVQIVTPSTVMDENVKADAVHLLALKEASSEVQIGMETCARFGFAFVDAAAGKFYVGSISDDASRSALGALLAQVSPQELLYELGGISEETRQAFRHYSSQGGLQIDLTPLEPMVEFMNGDSAIHMIKSNCYFESGNSANDEDTLGALKTLDDPSSAASALGALVSHLCRIKLDAELLKHGTMAPYEVHKGALRLNGQTLSNLEIFRNNADGGKAGTLLGYLDSCVTVFGKRLLRRWLCRPLQDVTEINARLDAVDELLARPSFSNLLSRKLRQLPDLERLIARVHGLAGLTGMAAIPVVGKKMQHHKVRTFCLAVKGLLLGFDVLNTLKDGDGEGAPQASLLRVGSALSDAVLAREFLEEIGLFIDEKLQRSKGNLVEEIKVEDRQKLDDLIPLFIDQSKLWISVIDILGRIDVLLALASSSLQGENGPTCRPVFVSKPLEDAELRPQKGGSVLSLKGLWHPFASGGQGGVFIRNDVELGSSHSHSPRAMLLTGPNMGGKSTLLRATCIAVIMAQVGCYVPAEACILSPADIIFTRLGAADRIMSGESTFFVECTEASAVLRYATRNSVVILDELGRGTSTFDGYAIAYAVFRHLVDTLDCRLLFATHYHPLTEEFGAHPSVTLQHMAFAFEVIDEGKVADTVYEEDSMSISEKKLVFLYKLMNGACPESYGLQVALLAGMPFSLVKEASRAARRMKQDMVKSFESVSHRKEFSHMHEQWLQSILGVLSVEAFDSANTEDQYDTLLCLWHEVKNSTRN